MKFKVGEMVKFKEPHEHKIHSTGIRGETEMTVMEYRGENIVYVKVMADFGWVCNSHISQDELLKV